MTDCRCLMRSSFPERVELAVVDTTQISNPPPPFAVRLLLAIRRFAGFLVRFERFRPDAVLLFAAVGASVVEKGAMAWYATLRGVPALFFPRAGGLMAQVNESRFTHAWVRLALGGADKILCQGEVWQRFVVRRLGRAVDDAPVVRNWIATPPLLQIGRRQRRSPRARRTRLLFTG